MADTNWDICFICQVSSKDICSSTEGYQTLAKNIPEFHKKGKLVSISREFVTLIRTYYQFWQQIKQFITTIAQKIKREESRHICQLNREKDSIYSVVDVVKGRWC